MFLRLDVVGMPGSRIVDVLYLSVPLRTLVLLCVALDDFSSRDGSAEALFTEIVREKIWEHRMKFVFSILFYAAEHGSRSDIMIHEVSYVESEEGNTNVQ